MTPYMIDEICGTIHNYFTDKEDIRSGEYIIEGGALDLDFLLPGQYFRIVGSAMNDGVWQHPADGLVDETFTGQIWPMRPPRAFLTMAEEISQWQDKYGAAMLSPYQSENVIGVYSYTKAATGSGGASSAAGWKDVFKNKLNRWRKLG